jgi:Transposase DDE domain
MSQQEFTRKGQVLQEFLGEVAEAISRSSGFVQRNSKLTGVLFVQTLLLGWLHNPTTSLAGLCYWAAQLGVQISPQGLGKRFTGEAVSYLSSLFTESLERYRQQVPLPAAVLQQFQGIYILDSTQISLPEKLQHLWRGSGGMASAAGLKLQLSLEYLSGSLHGVSLSQACQPDTACELHVHSAEAGSLHLFDLGYFKLDLFKTLQAAGAFFITRFRPHTILFSDPQAEQALDLEAFCQTIAGDRCEMNWSMGATARLPVRVLFSRYPPAVAEERRRKARASARKKRRNCTANHLAMQDWLIIITNVPPQSLTFEQVLVMYRIRWQVELIFKLCKSQLDLDHVSGCGEARILCQLYARLILLVLLCGLTAPWRMSAAGELSLPKAFQILTCYTHPLLTCIQQAWHSISNLLANMANDFLRFAQKTQRKKSPSTLQRLIQTEA